MANYGGFNENYRQQAQMLNMRGAQLVEQKTGRTAADGTTQKAKGTNKQLIGTIVGVVAVLAVVLILNSLF